MPLVLAAGEAGKEILYPVALVVLGGLMTSTLLDVAVTPTISFNYSGKAAARVAEARLKKSEGTAAVANRPGGGETQPPSESKQTGKD